MNLRFSQAAKADMAEIWVYNADTYGITHANEYEAYLYSRIHTLQINPNSGRPALDRPGYRYLIMKKRARGHGHAAYYRVDGDTIWIVRILHTAMHAPDHLPDVDQ